MSIRQSRWARQSFQEAASESKRLDQMRSLAPETWELYDQFEPALSVCRRHGYQDLQDQLETHAIAVSYAAERGQGLDPEYAATVRGLIDKALSLDRQKAIS